MVAGINREGLIDRLAIGLSGLCFVHCIASAVLVTMLTGMGQDGLLGTRAVVEAGGAAIAQDEATSVVWGMPGAVANAGLCSAVLPLSDLAPHLRKAISRMAA